MQLIAFDLDGTLCNTIADIAASMNRALCAHNIPAYTQEEIQSMVGHGMKELCRSAMPRGREPDWEQVMKTYYADYSVHLCDSTQPYPGIRETLHSLRQRGLKLAVVSNKPHQNTEDMLHCLFQDWKELFDCIQGQDPRFPVKPDPASLLYVLDALKVSPEKSLYVGDSDVDFAFARNAGLHFCGAAWGFKGRQLLEDLGSEFVIDDPLELPGIIDRLS